MPTKKAVETQAEQSARFQAEAERLIAAGELTATEAESGLERVLENARTRAKLDESGDS